ncbi:hypothetical protein GW17_00035632 [Ensete ventricosum]|nr:hypothetical protein GW17_00035632 [Ensete ventricosum]RZR86051.1 hypothetical protein BHM03_00013142 [Ensete ventricosum]
MPPLPVGSSSSDWIMLSVWNRSNSLEPPTGLPFRSLMLDTIYELQKTVVVVGMYEEEVWVRRKPKVLRATEGKRSPRQLKLVGGGHAAYKYETRSHAATPRGRR